MSMSDTNNVIIVDGQSCPVQEFPQKVQEANSKGKKLVEISKGVWKTLDNLQG